MCRTTSRPPPSPPPKLGQPLELAVESCTASIMYAPASFTFAVSRSFPPSAPSASDLCRGRTDQSPPSHALDPLQRQSRGKHGKETRRDAVAGRRHKQSRSARSERNSSRPSASRCLVRRYSTTFPTSTPRAPPIATPPAIAQSTSMASQRQRPHRTRGVRGATAQHHEREAVPSLESALGGQAESGGGRDRKNPRPSIRRQHGIRGGENRREQQRGAHGWQLEQQRSGHGHQTARSAPSTGTRAQRQVPTPVAQRTPSFSPTASREINSATSAILSSSTE